MILSIADTLSSYSSWASLLMVVGAIIYALLGHIFHLSAKTIICGVLLLLAFGWGFSFFTMPSRLAIAGLAFDKHSQISSLLLFPAMISIMFLSQGSKESDDKKIASLLLMLISFLGGLVLLASANWMVFFVALQCLSIPIYGLLAQNPLNKTALSAAVNYLVISIVAMAFMLFGIALIYAATGTLDFVAGSDQGFFINEKVAWLGWAFVLVGLAFKTSLVPFHLWAPQVYQGASASVATYLVVMVKAVVVFFLVRLLPLSEDYVLGALSLMALVSMWLGNGMMLKEKNFMRFLAYLSIGHLGFIVGPLLSLDNWGAEAIFLDFIAFSVAFLIVITITKTVANKVLSSWELSDFQGLAKRNSYLALALVIALASLMGLPLTAGFIAKAAALKAGIASDRWWFSLNMVLSSLLSLIALVRVLIAIYQPSSGQEDIKQEKPAFLLVPAVALLVFGLWPSPWVSWVEHHASENGQGSEASKDIVSKKFPSPLAGEGLMRLP